MTNLETKVYNYILSHDVYEEVFGDIDTRDIQQATGISAKQVRAILTTLQTKDLIYSVDMDTFVTFLTFEKDKDRCELPYWLYDENGNRIKK